MADESEKTVNELLTELVSNQAEQRAEVAALRNELAKSREPRHAPSSQVRSAEDLLADRMLEVEQHDFYCPGCGKLVDYQRECQGTGAAPHPPIEVVSTDEIKSGDEMQHTAAPSAY